MDRPSIKLKPRIEEKERKIQEGGLRVVSLFTHSPLESSSLFPSFSFIFFTLFCFFFALSPPKENNSFFFVTRLINSLGETASFPSPFFYSIRQPLLSPLWLSPKDQPFFLLDLGYLQPADGHLEDVRGMATT